MPGQHHIRVCAVLCGEGRRAEDEEEEEGKEDAVSFNSSAQHHKDGRTWAILAAATTA